MNTNDWTRGYLCAVAKMIELDGLVRSDVKMLFHAGGDWRLADPLDIEVFVEHGLVSFQAAPPNISSSRQRQSRRCERHADR